MKKFDRRQPEVRQNEIQNAALKLFNEKGFKATTMENIVQNVSLSKGGVYRIYPSTTAILSDLIINGMHLRNEYYVKRAAEILESKQAISIEDVVEMIIDSMFLYPEFSNVYVEFLWEKQRNPELEKLYQVIYRQTVEDTSKMITDFKTSIDINILQKSLENLADVMNSLIISVKVLGLEQSIETNRDRISEMIMLMIRNN